MAAPECKVIAIEHLSLDGVYQAPARFDEDLRGSFRHGGWSNDGDDPKMQEVIGRYMHHGWSLLVGRSTYEDLYEGWHIRQPLSPMTHALAQVRKFVASHNVGLELAWANSELLRGEAIESVASLKQSHDRTLVIFGSGVLVHSLMEAGLVDELVLMIHPIVLGEGRRFFQPQKHITRMRSRNTTTTESGVVIAEYAIASAL